MPGSGRRSPAAVFTTAIEPLSWTGRTWRFFSWTQGALGSGDASFVYLQAGTGMANHFFHRGKKKLNKDLGIKRGKGHESLAFSRQQAGRTNDALCLGEHALFSWTPLIVSNSILCSFCNR